MITQSRPHGVRVDSTVQAGRAHAILDVGGDMNGTKDRLKRVLEYTLPWIILAVLLTYSYADFFQHPYGFWWPRLDGIITKVFVNEREPTIHTGDKLVRVGSVNLQAFNADLRKDLFQGFKPGDTVPITVQRGDQMLTVEWRLPGINPGEIRDQLFDVWFLAYFFWIAGTMTLLVLRPMDERWFLMAAFDFLTSIWLIAGSGLSFFHIWYSALVLRCAIWLCVPVYLHLHWVFPRPLGRLPRPVLWGAYAGAFALIILQWFQLIPASLYFVGFLVAVAGSLLLLHIHFVRQPEIRRDLRLLLVAALLAVIPTITLAIVAMQHVTMPPSAGLALLSFPILPFAYLYAAYRRQLGGLEVRVNRMISIYAYLIILGVLLVPTLIVIDRLLSFSRDETLITTVIASVLVTAVTLWGFPIFQEFVEHRFFGIAVPSRELQQTYSSHITSSTSLSALTRLLHAEIMPSLLVRQFVFLVLDGGTTRALLSTGIAHDQIPPIQTLTSMMGEYSARPLLPEGQFSWMRVVLPLQVEKNLLGFWLFGRRDPDDAYSAVEIPILRSFANQTAVALSNILQTERLRTMYQADINRHELERLSLARDLHDSVLSELAGMLMNADIGTLPKNFQDGYKALTQRLREIVSDLRPPMLNYGLKAAIEELADNLMERSKDTMTVEVELEGAGERYPLDKEQHLFRIVQEACENAARHSRGETVTVSGRLAPDGVEIAIQDDGDGFQMGKQRIELYDLLREHHFGLAGMFERAELIHAEIQITTAPGDGTRILVRWQNSPSPRVADQGSGEFAG